MGKVKEMANKKGSHQLKWEDRISLEALLKAGHSVIQIANQLGVHRSTIYNELKRGRYMHRNTNYTETPAYSPNKAQQKAEENLKARGVQLKIGNDLAYANYIEGKILNEDYSPAAVLGELKATGKDKEFSTTICVTTLYSYIDKGVFLNLTNKNLPVKKNTKHKYRRVRKMRKRASAGESIDKRPEAIGTREEFGHWEMDSVLGKRGISKNTILALTERKTRNEIVFKLPDHTSDSVVKALDKLERECGTELFRKLFKTITVDNGTEFADAEGIAASIAGSGTKRTKVYYCHPYSSWERGSNEVTNKMIRRKVPKGTNFDGMPAEKAKEIADWINNYPRKIHGYHTAAELFAEEIKLLI
jgi:transposase, IS30 family